MQLQPYEIGTGGDLGDRMLDLETGVDLEECECLLTRVVEELDRARAAVADGEGQPLGRRLQLVRLVGAEQRRRGLLDHLLVAPLHGAVAYAERPGRAVAVGDDLHLDVSRTRHEPFEKHDVVAERAPGLVPGALVRLAQVGLVADHADPAPAPAGGGLQHHRVADLRGHLDRGVEGVDGAAAPRRDRDTDLLGKELRADLVAELAHGLRRRADEGDAAPRAQFGEVRVLRDEAPAHPGGVRSGSEQRRLEQVVVEVRTGARGAERVGDVCLAYEHGRRLGVGVQRDRPDRLGRGVLGVQIADGVDQSHRRFAPIDDRDPAGCSCVA